MCGRRIPETVIKKEANETLTPLRMRHMEVGTHLTQMIVQVLSGVLKPCNCLCGVFCGGDECGDVTVCGVVVKME